MGWLRFMKMDEYQLKARFFPSVIAMLSPAIYVMLLIDIDFNLNFNDTWKMSATVIILAAVSFLVQGLCRNISKYLFQFPLFREDETNMPTTKMLLYQTTLLSRQSVDNIVKMIEGDLHLKIDPQDNSEENRKVIAEAVRSIRGNFYNNKLLKGYNIDFGFIRNLMGGLILSTAILVLMHLIVVLFYSYPMEKVAAICFIVNFVLFLIAWGTLMSTGRAYARQLFSIYQGDNKNG